MSTEIAELWPALPYESWKDTYETLHMWLQVVGKVALAQAPPLNHSWAIALQVTPRGFSTRTLPHGDRTFSLQFDFVAHELVASASDGYQVVFSLAELDPGFTSNDIIVADTLDGKALFAYQGPLRIIAPKDSRAARSVRMLQRLDVVRLKKY